jgi:hypothetical protein
MACAERLNRAPSSERVVFWAGRAAPGVGRCAEAATAGLAVGPPLAERVPLHLAQVV